MHFFRLFFSSFFLSPTTFSTLQSHSNIFLVFIIIIYYKNYFPSDFPIRFPWSSSSSNSVDQQFDRVPFLQHPDAQQLRDRLELLHRHPGKITASDFHFQSRN